MKFALLISILLAILTALVWPQMDHRSDFEKDMDRIREASVRVEAAFDNLQRGSIGTRSGDKKGAQK